MLPPDVFNIQTANSFDWLSAASALIAVILGAVLTYFVTNRFETKRAKEQQLGQAYSLLFAVQKMSDDLVKLQQTIVETREKAKAAAVEGPLWALMDDVVGYSRTSYSISPESLALVAQMKDPGLLMGVMEVESAHRIYIESLRKFGELRGKMESSGLQAAVEGQTVSYAATPEEYARIAPTIIRLETLSQSFEEGVPRAVENARVISERLGPDLKKHFKFNHFMTIAFALPAGSLRDATVSPATD